jgi:hypothetical protein
VFVNEGNQTMNRTIYNRVRESIRGNGIAYTARMAAQMDDTDAMFVCDDIYNTTKGTDWLAMRQAFARNGSAREAFMLTTTAKKS